VRRGPRNPAAGSRNLAFSAFVLVRLLVSHFQSLNGLAPDPVTRTLARAVDSPSNTVLVVDDNAAIRFLCRVNLELDGWTVCEAATASEARAAVSEADVDVVLLDVHLGAESSLDFLAELRVGYPGLPVAMLTGSVGTPTLEGVTVDAVIPKPFKPEELSATVRRLAMRLAPNAG